MEAFRERYLSYDELTAQLKAWADTHPDHARLETLGTTPEGRELWLLRVGEALDEVRPAAWVDGNMHASELAGSSVGLAIAQDVLALHLNRNAQARGLPPHLRDVVRRVHLYVMPRMSPDGAQEVLDTGRLLRSVPRDERLPARSYWKTHDLDGDGRALLMRRRDCAGEFVESAEIPGLMVPRELDDAGPFYKLWPEGTIVGFDGHTVPSPEMTSDNDPDLNRNFPYDWAPEHIQEGAGPFALSEPESRAVADFAARHPNVFAWLNLHTYGGVFIRPLGTAPDNKMDPGDLGIWKEIESWAEPLTGYPMVSGFSDFTYEPDTPIHGDLTEFAYHSRGALSYVCELWDLFAQLGMDRPERFIDYYNRFDRAMLHRLARWDAQHNAGRIFTPWVPHAHPQLGPVEVGGMDIRIGIRNPPYERLPEICEQQASAFLRVIAMAPQPWASALSVTPLGGGLSRVELSVENRGYLATYVVPSSRAYTWNEPLKATVQTEGALRLVDERDGHRELGHLQGWGRGRETGHGTPGFLRSLGSVSARRLRWVVSGAGTFTVRVASCRVGTLERSVTIA